MRFPNSISKILSIAILALSISMSIVAPVKADGIIIPDPMPCPPDGECFWPPEVKPMTQLVIRYHHVDVEIRDQIAITRVDQVFFNPNDWTVEGSYIFPIPVGATVSEFSLWIDGEPVRGEMLEANEARETYEDIVREMRDPALLEYLDRGAFQAHIFPIPANGERRIELQYEQVLLHEDGLVSYIYPLSTEKFSAQPIESVSVSVRAESQEAIRAVYSPSHKINLEKIGEDQFLASYEETDVLPDQDFALYYSIGEAEAFHLFTYRDPLEPGDSDGFFMLLLAPRPGEIEEVIEKDVLLVIDRSGSMDGEKFRQAQEALTYILQHLQAEDRFYVMAFSDSIRSYSDKLLPAQEAEDAVDWVGRLSAAGSTDINRALLEAVAVAERGRPTYLIFLTDGLPTAGETESQDILDNVHAAASDNLRLFSFGLGFDVDTFLLDSLSQEHHGLSSYIQPGEPLNEKLSGFYARISTPVLTDLTIDFEDVVTYDIYPDPLPDLFVGSQVVVVGRYREGGMSDVVLKGRVNDEPERFVFPGEKFSDDSRWEDDPMSMLPRLWATRKVGYLLNKIRLEGPEEEMIEQVVQLSIRYGIVTPYTSYLVTEPLPLGAENVDSIARDVFQESMAAPTIVSGQSAVEKAAEEGELSHADVAPELPRSSERIVKLIGARTFIHAAHPEHPQEMVWLDTSFNLDRMITIPVAYLSRDYFVLAQYRKDIGAALALGPRVIFVLDGTAYEIVEEGALTEPLTLPAREQPLTSIENIDESQTITLASNEQDSHSGAVEQLNGDNFRMLIPCSAGTGGAFMILITTLLVLRSRI